MAYRSGDFQEAYLLAEKAVKIYPNHVESQELITILQKMFTSM